MTNDLTSLLLRPLLRRRWIAVPRDSSADRNQPLPPPLLFLQISSKYLLLETEISSRRKSRTSSFLSLRRKGKKTQISFLSNPERREIQGRREENPRLRKSGRNGRKMADDCAGFRLRDSISCVGCGFSVSTFFPFPFFFFFLPSFFFFHGRDIS